MNAYYFLRHKRMDDIINVRGLSSGILCTVIFIFYCSTQASAQDKFLSIIVSPDIRVIRISEHSYVHVSYTEVPGFGRVGSNGFIYANAGESLLFDTPMNDSLTGQLIDWIRDSLHLRIVGFIPNHWHNDCMGGLDCVARHGIPSYASEMTRTIAREKELPVPQHGFADSLVLHLGERVVFCRYEGPAHSPDNIVAWFPSEKILFGGCMVKELQSATLGNTADANLSEWPNTIKKVLEDFPAAELIIPGHGAFGGRELLTHTLDLLSHRK